MAQKLYVWADSAVLYSASQRANKGRARYKNSGLTASIYLSEKLGGKQVGTLFHSIAIKNGPAFFTSVSNTKADTIRPLLVEQLPYSTPLFTDEGYPWLFGVFKNHRSVNHSAKSKDSRYKLAKNRWCRDGVHNQVAEGNHRLVKAAFSAYGYIRPEFSQLYLDEFSFLKNTTTQRVTLYGSQLRT
ncbi:transposase [Leptospira santarosai]|uniref:ISXO2-like transposase domain protein n=1 Tax=Leptospira santarosai str. ZUN179 TaxID=1049985 RepID=M6VAP0_9LEPT|nr:ISXO2-like transposase domain protein [Leptospira santarosai str. ZUN179]